MTSTIGSGTIGGGGGGGAVDSVNGQTGVVVLGAADVGADPAGTAAAAILAHESAPDPHPQYTDAAEAAAAAPVQDVFGRTGSVVAVSGDYDVSEVTDALDRTGDTMSGDLSLGGNDLLGADNVAVYNERFPAFVLGNAPGPYNVLKSYTLAVGEALTVEGTITVSRGSGATRESRSMTFMVNGRNQGAAAIAASEQTSNQNGDGPIFQFQWLATSGTDLSIALRDANGTTADVTLIASETRTS